jgi:uncharacterized iron-regulated protein
MSRRQRGKGRTAAMEAITRDGILKSALLTMAVLATFLLLSGFGTAGVRAHIINTQNQGILSVPELIDEVKSSDLVFVGESHDNPAHHAAQLEIIRSLRESNGKLAIGLEMFLAGSQGELDDWVAGSTPEDRFVRIFNENWERGSWPLYRPIFVYARDHRIPLVGLNLDRSIVREVARSGSQSLRSGNVPGVRDVKCDASERYQRYLRKVLRGHGRHAGYHRFCEAQMLWDAAMAWNLIDFAESNQDITVVVIAGGGHSWKHGIPERIARQSTLSYKVILPSGEKDSFGYDISHEEADFVWWIDA